VFGGILIKADPERFAVASDGHVVVAGGDPNTAWIELSSGLSFFHHDGSASAEVLGEQSGKEGRHVLHNDDRYREVGGKQRDHFTQGIRPASRCADGHDIDAARYGTGGSRDEKSADALEQRGRAAP